VIHAAVAIYINAGLRREEALWLTREEVDLVSSVIRVRAKTIDGRRWQPKTGRNRVVPISQSLFETLLRYEPPGECVWYLPSPTGKQWHPDNFSQHLKQLNEAAGLRWTCLDFRHTFGSHLAQKGESLYKIATLMSSSPEICRRHYAALVPEEMHDTVEFTQRGAADEEATETRALLEQVLLELREIKSKASGSPAPGELPGERPLG
jgi:integrase